MTYYAHINSKNILTGIDMSKISADEYGSKDVKNIEVDNKLCILNKRLEGNYKLIELE